MSFNSKTELQNAVARNRTRHVLEWLSKHPGADNKQRSQLILQVARLNEIEEDEMNGTASMDDIRSIRSRLQESLLNFVDKHLTDDLAWIHLHEVDSETENKPSKKPRMSTLVIASTVLGMLVSIQALLEPISFKPKEEKLTIQVFDLDQDDKTSLENIGFIIIEYEDRKEMVEIMNLAQAELLFKHSLKGKQFSVTLVAEGYELIEPDKKYTFGSESISLGVRAVSEMVGLSGTVLDSLGQVIPKASFSIEGTNYQTLSSNTGHIILDVPEVALEDGAHFIVEKEGFRSIRIPYGSGQNRIEIMPEFESNIVSEQISSSHSYATITIRNRHVNFGELVEGQVFSYTFSFKNNGNARLKIQSVETSTSDLTIGEHTQVVQPGEEGRLHIQFAPDGVFGFQKRTIILHGNQKGGRTQVTLSGTITTATISVHCQTNKPACAFTFFDSINKRSVQFESDNDGLVSYDISKNLVGQYVKVSYRCSLTDRSGDANTKILEDGCFRLPF